MTKQNAHDVDPRLAADDPPVPPGLGYPLAEDVLVHAWDLLKLFLARFWTPVQLATMPAISQWRLFDCLDWLRPVELMLRRLIMIEAVALAPTLPAPPARRARREPRAKPWPDPDFAIERSETWPAVFRNLPLSRPGRPDGHRKYPAPELGERIAPRDHGRTRNPWPLAYRIEAVIRVITNPMAQIRRLAASLRRRGVPGADRFAASQRCRIPSAWPTIDQLALDLGVKPRPPDDS